MLTGGDQLTEAKNVKPTSELPLPKRPSRLDEFLEELKAGWRFLRHEPVLLANTIQATVGQFTVGVLLALTPFYARDLLGSDPGIQLTLDPTSVYAFLEKHLSK